MPLETFAASKLVQKMLSSNASQEELYNAKKYLLAAVDYDSASLALKSVANETNIKELSKKYPLYGSWMGSSDISAKELLNLNFGVPKHEYDFSKTKVGDKITVDLKELGKFEATAYEVTDNNVLFIFDDYIAERPMNEKPTNEGGYEKSDLKKWIDSYLYSLFPLELKTRIIELTIRVRSGVVNRIAVGVHTGKVSRRVFFFHCITKPAPFAFIIKISNSIASLFHKWKLFVSIWFKMAFIPRIVPANNLSNCRNGELDDTPLRTLMGFVRLSVWLRNSACNNLPPLVGGITKIWRIF